MYMARHGFILADRGSAGRDLHGPLSGVCRGEVSASCHPERCRIITVVTDISDWDRVSTTPISMEVGLSMSPSM